MAMGEQYAPLDFLRGGEEEPEPERLAGLSARERQVLVG